MSILIKTVRIAGFRGLKNLEVNLEPVTVLTGMNNTGKTSFLKALQIALGNRQFISQDDFYISDNKSADEIIIDIKIIPLDSDAKPTDTFSEIWETLFTDDRIIIDIHGNSFVPLRTVVTFDEVKNTFKSKQYILKEWSEFEESGLFWYKKENGNEKGFSFDEIPFFYMDAQRDIIEDIKLKSSYLGRMISKIEYDPEDIKKLEAKIEELNEQAVSSSDVLKNIKDTLKQLDTAMNTSSEGVEITPFTKKIRDLSKGLSIYYSDKSDSFSMEYHGMGTRSWSSLLTLKSFITLLSGNSEQAAFFPILAIEEPEAHLHPNAQKKLYNQIATIAGQKIISTHSPYVAASAELEQIRNFYKEEDNIACGFIDIAKLSEDGEDERKIKRQVINTRGEIFFSKAIVFFEGETEEQALPVFAKKYFGKTATEMAIDFVGVGGFGNYLPFIRVAEGLNIPWFILSDGENDAKKGVQKALKKLYNKKEVMLESENNIFVLDNGCDFEKYLIETDYLDEIKLTFQLLHGDDYLEQQILKKDGTKKERVKTVEICDRCNQNIYQDILRDYSGDEGFKSAVYDCMIAQKTQLGPVVAEKIIDSRKDLPPKINDLFNKIKEVI